MTVEHATVCWLRSTIVRKSEAGSCLTETLSRNLKRGECPRAWSFTKFSRIAREAQAERLQRRYLQGLLIRRRLTLPRRRTMSATLTMTGSYSARSLRYCFDGSPEKLSARSFGLSDNNRSAILFDGTFDVAITVGAGGLEPPTFVL